MSTQAGKLACVRLCAMNVCKCVARQVITHATHLRIHVYVCMWIVCKQNLLVSTGLVVRARCLEVCIDTVPEACQDLINALGIVQW